MLMYHGYVLYGYVLYGSVGLVLSDKLNNWIISLRIILLSISEISRLNQSTISLLLRKSILLHAACQSSCSTEYVG